MDIVEVYHAGTDIVEFPNCKRGRVNLDFGQGFYVTDIYDQAYNFALTKSRDRNLQGFISKDRALRNLRYLKPNNQICILNQEMLDRHLKFVDCLNISTNGLL